MDTPKSPRRRRGKSPPGGEVGAVVESTLPAVPPAYRGTMALVIATGKHPNRILSDLRAGKFEADKPGREHLFTPAQFDAACAYYAGLGASDGAAGG